jgi:NADP-dependent 3-hydroxy acid dehydrogenase YdfG
MSAKLPLVAGQVNKRSQRSRAPRRTTPAASVMLLGPFDSDQRHDYRQMIEVNLLGAITATEVFLDQVKDGGGDIINISHCAGRA